MYYFKDPLNPSPNMYDNARIIANSQLNEWGPQQLEKMRRGEYVDPCDSDMPPPDCYKRKSTLLNVPGGSKLFSSPLPEPEVGTYEWNVRQSRGIRDRAKPEFDFNKFSTGKRKFDFSGLGKLNAPDRDKIGIPKVGQGNYGEAGIGYIDLERRAADQGTKPFSSPRPELKEIRPKIKPDPYTPVPGSSGNLDLSQVDRQKFSPKRVGKQKLSPSELAKLEPGRDKIHFPMVEKGAQNNQTDGETDEDIIGMRQTAADQGGIPQDLVNEPIERTKQLPDGRTIRSTTVQPPKVTPNIGGAGPMIPPKLPPSRKNSLNKSIFGRALPPSGEPEIPKYRTTRI